MSTTVNPTGNPTSSSPTPAPATLDGERADALAALQNRAASDDTTWAEPQAQASVGWKAVAALLAAALVGMGAFSVGVRYQKSRPATGAVAGFGPGAFGRGGFGGGSFPTGGGPTGSSGVNTDALSQIFGTPAPTVSPGAAASSGTSVPAGTDSIRGNVSSVDGSTLTITKADGSTVKVTIGDSTQIGRRSAVAVSEVAPGVEVSVDGSTGADGVVAATSVTMGDLPADAATPTSNPGAAPATEAPGLGGLLPSG